MSAPKMVTSNGQGARISSPAANRFRALNWYPQQANWVRDPHAPENAAYNYSLPLRIRGPLHTKALQSCLQDIVRRHEVLRSAFRLEGTTLFQHVLPAAHIRMKDKDYTNLPPEVAESKARPFAVEEALRPFDLRQGTLVRASLLRICPEDHLLILTTHHAVCDDWSTAILLRELSALYSAHADGKPSPLPNVGPSYSRFATELASRIATGGMQPQTRFWNQFLAGAGDFHHLVPDYPRTSLRTWACAHEFWHCPEILVGKIKTLAVREQVSPFMVLLAAFQCALAHHSLETGIGVGSCVANRLSTEVEHLVGPLSNRVILRVDLSGGPSLREVLRRVRASSLDVYSHQDLPFGDLVEERGCESASNRNPLFQTLLVQREDPMSACEFRGLDVSCFEIDAGTTRYDLNVWLQFKAGQGLDVDFQYSSELFKPSTVRSLLESYQTFLRVMVENSDLRISEISPVAPRKSAPLQFVSPRDDRSSRAAEPAETEIRLKSIFQEVLGVHSVGIHSDFFELGGNSLQAVQLFAHIEREFQVKLPVSLLIRARTVAAVARAIRGSGDASQNGSFVTLQPHGSRPPLFCVHSHRGDVLFCGALSRHLGLDQPLVGFQSRGLSGASPHFTVQEMADWYVEELLRSHPSGPYLLFGFSFGGFVAFEMAARLVAGQHRVAFLGMFNTPAPGCLARWPLGQPSYLRGRTSHVLETSDAMPGGARVAHLARKLSSFGRTLASSARTDLWRFAASFMSRPAAERFGRRILDVEHINIAAAKEYQPHAILPLQITFFVSRRYPYLYSVAPVEGWSPFAARGVELVDVARQEGLPFEAELSGALETKINAC